MSRRPAGSGVLYPRWAQFQLVDKVSQVLPRFVSNAVKDGLVRYDALGLRWHDDRPRQRCHTWSST